jgi:hypothetical protein
MGMTYATQRLANDELAQAEYAERVRAKVAAARGRVGLAPPVQIKFDVGSADVKGVFI